MTTHSIDNLPSYQAQRTCTPNILIVGETGVGKSSAINLIAGERLADVSSGACGRTMETTSYDIILTDKNRQGHHIRLFDTVRLNEPGLSKTNYPSAIERANVLITQLLRTGGIRLLIFCIRGGKITSVTQDNYRLSCDILCQNRVPVAFVITGMENEKPMEGWWSRNPALFERSDLFRTPHVCVTVTPGLRNMYAKQCQASQAAIRNMFLNHMFRPSWSPERKGWFVGGKVVEVGGKAHGSSSALRSRVLTVEELAWHLEDKCIFSPEDVVVLAGKIWAKRTENGGSDFAKEEDLH